MKNIKTLSAIALTVVTAANVFTATASAASSKNYAKSQKKANAIVNEWIEDAVEAVQDGDKKDFYELFDDSWTSAQLDSEWNFFEERFCGNDNYMADGTALAFTKKEINFSAIFYCNTIDGTDTSSKYSTTNNLGLKNYNGKWKMFQGKWSNSLSKKIEAAKTEIYGENAYNNGFRSGDYQMIYGKALKAGINVDVKTAVLNKNGSVTLVIGFANGFDKAKTIKSISGTISFGKSGDSTKQIIDLSKIKLSKFKVAAGDVKYVTVTVKKNKLINKLSGTAELTHCSSNINTKYSN